MEKTDADYNTLVSINDNKFLEPRVLEQAMEFNWGTGMGEAGGTTSRERGMGGIRHPDIMGGIKGWAATSSTVRRVKSGELARAEILPGRLYRTQKDREMTRCAPSLPRPLSRKEGGRACGRAWERVRAAVETKEDAWICWGPGGAYGLGADKREQGAGTSRVSYAYCRGCRKCHAIFIHFFYRKYSMCYVCICV